MPSRPCVAMLLLFGCGKEPSLPTAAPKAAEEKIPPYTYPAPVKGHVKEVNIGQFDLVDGIAYPSVAGGTVVFVVGKPIASPALVGSACRSSRQRRSRSCATPASAKLRSTKGHSKSFAAGTPFHGSIGDRRPGGPNWQTTLKLDADRAAGSVANRHARFKFDLPLSSPQVDELSYGDLDQNRRLAANTFKPTEQSVKATYEKLRDAALHKDPRAMLAAMGFDAKQTMAIRGLDGIVADFAVFSDRFLTPGTPGDPTR